MGVHSFNKKLLFVKNNSKDFYGNINADFLKSVVVL